MRVERRTLALGPVHVVLCTMCGTDLASVSGALSSKHPEAIAAEWRESYLEHRLVCA